MKLDSKRFFVSQARCKGSAGRNHLALGTLTILLCVGCHKDAPTTSDPPELKDAIVISSPTVFARERLLNEEIAESQALQQELKEVSDATGQVDQAISTSSKLGVGAHFSAGGASGESNLAGGNSTESPKDDSAALKLSLLDSLRNKESLRSRLNAALEENEFGDSESQDGRSLFRFQFSVSLLPLKPTEASAHVDVEFHKQQFDYAYVHSLYDFMLAEASAYFTEDEGRLKGVDVRNAKVMDLLRNQPHFRHIKVMMGADRADDESCSLSATVIDDQSNTVKQPDGDKKQSADRARAKCIALSLAVPSVDSGDSALDLAALNDLLTNKRKLGSVVSSTRAMLTRPIKDDRRLQTLLFSNQQTGCYGDTNYGVSQISILKNIVRNLPPEVDDPAYLAHVVDTIIRYDHVIRGDLYHIQTDTSLDGRYQKAAERLETRVHETVVHIAGMPGWFRSMRVGAAHINCPPEQWREGWKNTYPDMPFGFPLALDEALQQYGASYGSALVRNGNATDTSAPKHKDAEGVNDKFANEAMVLRLQPTMRTVAEGVADEKLRSLSASVAAAAAAQATAGASLDSSVDRLVRAIDTKASIISFVETTDPEKGANPVIRNGWILEPDKPSGVAGHDWVQKERTELLSADVLIPTWWPRVVVDVHTYWTINDSAQKLAFQSERFVKSIGQQSAQFDQLVQMVIGHSPLAEESPPKIGSPTQSEVINPCKNDVAVIINGGNLWHSPKVYLGGQEATNITVLPNMDGIVAHFDATKFGLSDHAEKLSLEIATASIFQRFDGIQLNKTNKCPAPANK